MRSSSKYVTAVHICIFLRHMPDEILSSAIIAESVKTNPVVIRRLIHDLREKDIIKSIGGPAGGFCLARDASDISLWDIYVATKDDELFKRPKVNPECVVSSNLKLLVHDVFTEAELSMKNTLQQTSIEDLNHNLTSILGTEEAGPAIREGR